MSDNAIEVQNLTKRYGQTTVVRGISFSVRRGEIFGLLGPNGSGKTTTILMLLGLTQISDGQVRLLGHDPVRAFRSPVARNVRALRHVPHHARHED